MSSSIQLVPLPAALARIALNSQQHPTAKGTGAAPSSDAAVTFQLLMAAADALAGAEPHPVPAAVVRKIPNLCV